MYKKDMKSQQLYHLSEQITHGWIRITVICKSETLQCAMLDKMGGSGVVMMVGRWLVCEDSGVLPGNMQLSKKVCNKV